MTENPNQPREYDAVKGGQAPLPVDSAILGGLEGVKSRLASAVEQQRIAALSEALKYEEAGVDLVIQALQDKSELVEGAAYRLLRKRGEPRVKQALREYKPWRLFECLHTFGGHSSPVDAFVISSDGQTLVSDSSDGTIKVWNLHTGRRKSTLEGHLRPVYAFAISPDGQTLVSGSNDSTIKVWNLHARELKRTLKGHSGEVKSVAICPDGQTIVSASNGEIKVWGVR
jgi:WD40 repeat protein